MTTTDEPNSRGKATERSPYGDQRIDTTVPNEARVYDALLGGVANFAVDREQAQRQGEAVGGIEIARAAVRANRVFLGEVVRYLVRSGIRQFLDIGSGLPTELNVHEVAQQAAPESRIVYIDYDPIVMAHARKLLTSNPAGATDYYQADFRYDADVILERAARTLDFSQPIALLLLSFLHFFPDEQEPQAIVRQLLDTMAPGSMLTLSHLTADTDPEAMRALAESADRGNADYTFVMRTRTEVERFLEGLEPLEGGVVPMLDWLPDDTPQLRDCARMYYCGLGRTPAA